MMDNSKRRQYPQYPPQPPPLQQQYPPQQQPMQQLQQGSVGQANGLVGQMGHLHIQPPSLAPAATPAAATLAPSAATPAAATLAPAAGMPYMQQVALLGQAPAVEAMGRAPSATTTHIPSVSPTRPAVHCPPTFQRCTLQVAPQSYALLSKSRLPFGLIVNPYRTVQSHELVPVLGATDNVLAGQPVFPAPAIVRCRRCRAYINPYVQFVDHAHWRCNICHLINEVPSFFDYDMSGGGEYVDRFTRPEVSHAVIEYVAPQEYMVRPPQPPVFVFLIDVTANAIHSGVLHIFANTLLQSLDLLPNTEERTRIAFITVDASIHFYHLSVDADTGDPNEPRMMVVSDLDDVFLPAPEGLLIHLSENRKAVDAFLHKLPAMFNPTTVPTSSSSNALGAALQAALQMISSVGGKLIVIQSSLPNLGPGALSPREDPKMLGTPSENGLLQPASSFYKSLAVDCSKVQVSVDMFLFANQYMDMASLMGSVRFTSGTVYFYPGFHAQRMEDTEKFVNEFQHFLGRPLGLEAVLRVRASKGVRVEAFHGHFFVRSSDLLAVPNVSPDNTYAFQLTVEETLTTPYIVIQSALLYTTSFSERRIRIITTCLPVVQDIKDLYRHIDQGAMANLLARMAVERALTSKLEDARDALVNKCVDMLGVYRANFTSGQGQLVVDECFKLLPVLILAMIKHRALRPGSQVPTDFRTHAMALLRTLAPENAIKFTYGTFYELHSMRPEVGYPLDESRSPSSQSAPGSRTSSPSRTTRPIVLPTPINLTSERIQRHGMYLLDTFDALYLWVGRDVPAGVIKAIFDRPSYETIPSGKFTLPVLTDSPLNQRLRNIISEIRCSDGARQVVFPTLHVVKEEQGDGNLKVRFLSYLVEDRHDFGVGYVQFITEVGEKVNKGSF